MGTLHREKGGEKRGESSQGDKERATMGEERKPRECAVLDQIKEARLG